MNGDTFMKLESQGLEQALSDLAYLTSRSAAEILKDHAVMLGRYLAESTPPFVQAPGVAGIPQLRRFDGGSVAAKKLGEAAVARDIGRVYRAPTAAMAEMKARGAAGAAMSKAFNAAIRRRDVGEAQRILSASGVKMRGLQIAMFDGGAAHRAKRNKRGRINQGNAPILVMDWGKITEYRKKIQSHVGHTKSGWLNAASQISGVGRTRVNAWIKDRGGAGHGEDNTQNTNYPTVRLTNEVDWINNTMPESFHANAMESFDRSLKSAVIIAVNYLIKKHNL